MKKKTLLATLVMISLLQGNVYADKIVPGTYEDEFEYVHSPNDWSYTINTPGEYNFKLMFFMAKSPLFVSFLRHLYPL